MLFHPVPEAFGGNLKIVDAAASTANQHAPHRADDHKGHLYRCAISPSFSPLRHRLRKIG